MAIEKDCNRMASTGIMPKPTTNQERVSSSGQGRNSERVVRLQIAVRSENEGAMKRTRKLKIK
jgi:hypothetical protein